MSNYPGALSGGFVSHRFQSLKSDQPDLSVINPSNWNQSHIIGSGAIQSGALGTGVGLGLAPVIIGGQDSTSSGGGVHVSGGNVSASGVAVAIYLISGDANPTAIGIYPFIQATVGLDTYIGVNAGSHNWGTSGNINGNTGVGYQALYYNNSGSNMTALGASAGYLETAASNDVLIGNSAGFNTTTASYVTALGSFAGFSLTTGSWNTLLGFEAGYSLVTADSNTLVGYFAGYQMTGSRNIAVGFRAGYYDSGMNDHLWIDNHDRGNAANSKAQALIYGVFVSGGNLSGQSLTVNGLVNAPYGVAFTGSGTITIASGVPSIMADSNSGANIIINAPIGQEIKFYTNALNNFHIASGLIYPDSDAVMSLGTGGRRLFNVLAANLSVYHASGDPQPTAQLSDNALNFGAGNSVLPDTQISRMASGQLSLSKSTTSTLTVGGHLVRILNKAGIPTDADFTNPGDGIMVIDTTDVRLYVRTGGGWHYAALT